MKNKPVHKIAPISHSLFEELLSMRGYAPSMGVLIAALRPGYLIEWEADSHTGERHYAIVLDVTSLGAHAGVYDSLIKVICASKTFIFPGQIVAIHSVPDGDLDRFRA
jgi:hypothetical protein